MAVERIDKTDRLDYWKVQSTSETHKDKGQGQEENHRDAYAALGEKTDWESLFDKSQVWKRNIQVFQEEIDAIIFKKINLKTDPSLLRVDILLKGGEKISPAFMAISRAIGLRIKNLKAGDVIPEEYVLQDNVLRITVPTNPKLFKDEDEQPKKAAQKKLGEAEEATVKRKTQKAYANFLNLKDPETNQVRMEVVAGYGIAFLLLLLLIGGFFILR